jgi:four helix bundle protein
VRILEITAALPETSEGRVVRQQLGAAGTSVGANVEEADGAISKLDQRKSLVVARKEIREVRYWLRIIDYRWKKALDVLADIGESTELLNILSTMTARLS